MMENKRRVGIVGYGKLGEFLAQALLHDETVSSSHELAFVWNRRPEVIGNEIPQELRLDKLADFAKKSADLIVEVAHPHITRDYGKDFVAHADYMAGSPTAFADQSIEDTMRVAADNDNNRGVYIPRGALPGIEEIIRLAESGSVTEALITMRKHPSSLKFGGELEPPLEQTESERQLYHGPLREP